MVGEMLSVDFTYPDCDEGQMVLHFRVPQGVVIGGLWDLTQNTTHSKCARCGCIEYPFDLFDGLCDGCTEDKG